MAQKRPRAAELARLLQSANQPIYVLDEEQTLIYCNQACLDWVEQTSEALLGQRCAYHSSPEVTGPEAVAAGLCPPPKALLGESMTELVSSRGKNGKIRRRKARFTPLGSGPEENVGLLVVVEPQDLPHAGIEASEESSTEDASATELHRQLEQFRAESANRYHLDRLAGNCPAMRRIRAQVKAAAASRANVLIVGPPGSGRQHVASTIHYAGVASQDRSLVSLACAVLGAELIQSTVAALVARGSSGQGTSPGTLLLSDVDQLPPEAQLELARALTLKSFPFCVLATSRQSLGRLVEEGAYREDLAAFFSTLEISLPPLAQRRDDIPLLAQWFLEDVNMRSGKQVGGFSDEAIDRLVAYPWPGNMDELARVVEETHRDVEGAEIQPGDLPKRIHWAAEAAARPRRPEEKIVLDTFLDEIERELIARALARAKGNKAQAARLLGMSRPRLYRRLVQLGFEEGESS